jgi:hypothetical protein
MEQAAPLEQTKPHPPQLSASKERSTHASPQQLPGKPALRRQGAPLKPASQTTVERQRAATQRPASPQETPQPPQFVESDSKKQFPEQQKPDP